MEAEALLLQRSANIYTSMVPATWTRKRCLTGLVLWVGFVRLRRLPGLVFNIYRDKRIDLAVLDQLVRDSNESLVTLPNDEPLNTNWNNIQYGEYLVNVFIQAIVN